MDTLEAEDEKKMSGVKLWLTVDQSAEALCIGRRTLERRIQAGEIPICRIGHKIRIPLEDLKAWASAQRHLYSGEAAA